MIFSLGRVKWGISRLLRYAGLLVDGETQGAWLTDGEIGGAGGEVGYFFSLFVRFIYRAVETSFQQGLISRREAFSS